MNLTINNSTSASSAETACDTYTWAAPLGDGQTYNASGTYTHVSQNASGCDHTQTLNLTINYSTSASSAEFACDSYTWSVDGNTYTTSGTYTYTISGSAGSQVTAGSHNSNFNASMTRGYYFQAQTSFNITSLYCADEAGPSAARQSVEVVDFGTSAPLPYNNTSGSHTVLHSAIDVAAGWESCNVNIVAGNYYGIIGAKHDAGSTQMYNSYGSGGSVVTIDGLSLIHI